MHTEGQAVQAHVGEACGGRLLAPPLAPHVMAVDADDLNCLVKFVRLRNTACTQNNWP
jgi:hypothetical protein